jgi:hypothetical protein
MSKEIGPIKGAPPTAPAVVIVMGVSVLGPFAVVGKSKKAQQQRIDILAASNCPTILLGYKWHFSAILERPLSDAIGGKADIARTSHFGSD